MAAATTIAELLEQGRRQLEAAGLDNAHQECRWMLAALLELTPGQLPFHLPETANDAIAAAFRRQVGLRASGLPLQYVMGTAEFRSLLLQVGPGVLIPRPETEQLVDLALELLPPAGRACDLCTGSGAIALALASERPDSRIVATDLSEQALAYARDNQRRIGLANVSFFLGDLFQPLPPGTGPFDLVASNPPYVTEAEYAELDPGVRDHEPKLALTSGADGLDLLRRLLREAKAWLRPGGWLLCEIGAGQGPALLELLKQEGYAEAAIRQDYSGRDRFALGRQPRSQVEP